MAAFDYTVASWKKIKPPLFPKTGMTDALADFEKTGKKLFAAGNFDTLLDAAGPAMEAFDKVEKCRKEALAKSSKIFKETRAALEKAPSAQTVNKLHDAIGKVGGRELDDIARKLGEMIAAKRKRIEEIQKILTALKKLDSLDPGKQTKFLVQIYNGYLQQSSSMSGGKRQSLPGIDPTVAALLTKRHESLVAKSTPMLLTRFSRVVGLVQAVKEKDQECADIELSLRQDAMPLILEAGITAD